MRKITSYNFDTDALIHAGFNHILGWPARTAEEKKQPYAVQGYISDRGSTGPACNA
jgi:hypothetical protein